MRGHNSITISGALVRDAEMKYTQGGLAILTLDVGGVEHIGDKELPFYHRATVFGRYAETIVESMVQGAVVFLTGRLNFRSWEAEGQTRNAVDITVERIFVLGGGELSYDARNQPRLLGAINQVVLGGNLTRDAEMRYTPSGVAVTRLGLAVNEHYRDSQGKDQERVGFYNVDAWNDLAEANAAATKGTPLIVQGRLKNSNWTDKEGNKRYATEIEASSIARVATQGAEPKAPVATTASRATPPTSQARGSRANPPSRQALEDEFPDFPGDMPF